MGHPSGHGAGLPPVDESLDLRDHVRTGVVRQWVRDRLGSWLDPDRVENVVLVVSELVANAYQHTQCPQWVRLTCHDATVQIEVSDGDPTPPRLQPVSNTRLSGRGIHIVDNLSAAWGVRLHDEGKTVWSRMVLPAAPSAVDSRTTA